MLVCLGSQALKYRGIDCNPVDLDLLGTYSDIRDYCHSIGKVIEFYPIDNGKKIFSRILKDQDVLIIESEIAYSHSTAYELLQIVKSDPDSIIKDNLLIPTINVLYLLKMSHRYLKDSPHFLKTMKDIKLLRKLGASIKKEHDDFYIKRMRETYFYNHPRLNVSKQEFFNSGNVKYIYEHDSIHESMKHLDVPAYILFKKPGSEVFCQKELFDKLPELHKIYAVAEEAYVLALERSQIPLPGCLTPNKSFEIALMKICTSITSGWFREYAWEHWDQVWDIYNSDYVNKFLDDVNNNKVKKC